MTRAGSAHLYSTRELSQYRNNAILDLTPRVERGGGRGEERILPIRAIEVERSPSESNTPHSKLPSALVVLVRYEWIASRARQVATCVRSRAQIRKWQIHRCRVYYIVYTQACVLSHVSRLYHYTVLDLVPVVLVSSKLYIDKFTYICILVLYRVWAYAPYPATPAAPARAALHAGRRRPANVG